MRTFLFLVLSTPLLFQAGCGGGDSGRPADLPKLYPVSITITQGDQPLEGATVTLVSTPPAVYGTSGTTNASGTAVLRTYSYDGAPAGDYAVLVKKVGAENQRDVTITEGVPVMAGGQSYNYVDARFSTKDGTTLNITVTEKGAKESFDVGAPVRIFLGHND
jgi:hypothetical protein